MIPDRAVLRIPTWVRWVAQDSTGAWWGYSAEPLRHDSGWYENEAGRYVPLGQVIRTTGCIHCTACVYRPAQALGVIPGQRGDSLWRTH